MGPQIRLVRIFSTDIKRTGLWSGLRETFNSGSSTLPLQDMIERMLFAEAIETQKCIDEGVITSSADCNIDTIFGIGFPPWTGGTVQYVLGYTGGKAGFVARAKELAVTYGDRFLPRRRWSPRFARKTPPLRRGRFALSPIRACGRTGTSGRGFARAGMSWFPPRTSGDSSCPRTVS